MKLFVLLFSFITVYSYASEEVKELPYELNQNICEIFGEESFLKKKVIEINNQKIILRSVYNGKDESSDKRLSKSGACVVNNLWYCHQLTFQEDGLTCHNNRYGVDTQIKLSFNGVPVKNGQKANAYFAISKTIQDIFYAKNYQSRVLKYGSCNLKVGINKVDYKKHYSVKLMNFSIKSKKRNDVELLMSDSKKTCYSNLTVNSQGVSCYTKSMEKCFILGLKIVS
jgi:hypothetical protein